jgi:2-polyprenyl-6-methoxyphenol hydroxylase-like FAD-dependent oxidoreductase
MNACIQDAVNLGWKLALVASNNAEESLLDSYQTERLPIAEQVITGTDLLHKVIMSHGKPIEERFAITRAPGFNQKAVAQISGLLRLDGPQAGDRAPNIRINERLRPTRPQSIFR